MNTAIRPGRGLRLLPCILFALAVLPSVAAAEDEVIDLRDVPLPIGMRAGYGVSARAMPPRALAFDRGGYTWLLIDLDGNRKIQAGKDGIAILGRTFVVQLTPTLLLPGGQYRQSVVKNQLRLTPEDLSPLSSEHIDMASEMTVLRISNALTPVRLDPAGTKACMAHLEYLKKHPVDDLRVHDEDPTKEGYTPEGAKAAEESNICHGDDDLRDCLRNTWATAWHGASLIDPCLTEFSVGQLDDNYMIYIRATSGTLGSAWLSPPDGAVCVQTEFSEGGEEPPPYRDGASGDGCGFPIMVFLAGRSAKLTKAIVTGPDGKPLAGELSSPPDPVTREHFPDNDGLAMFMPNAPLAVGWHKVRFEFDRGAPIEWTFSTGDRMPPPPMATSDREVRDRLALPVAAREVSGGSGKDLLGELAAGFGLAISFDTDAASAADDAEIELSLAEGTLQAQLDAIAAACGVKLAIKRSALSVSLAPDQSGNANDPPPQEADDPPAGDLPDWAKGTPHHDAMLAALRDVVSRNHESLDAPSVAAALDTLSEGQKEKLVRALDYRIRNMRGEERSRVREVRDRVQAAIDAGK